MCCCRYSQPKFTKFTKKDDFSCSILSQSFGFRAPVRSHELASITWSFVAQKVRRKSAKYAKQFCSDKMSAYNHDRSFKSMWIRVDVFRLPSTTRTLIGPYRQPIRTPVIWSASLDTFLYVCLNVYWIYHDRMTLGNDRKIGLMHWRRQGLMVGARG